MQHNIYIGVQDPHLDNFNYVNIQDINTIVNHSCGYIIFDVLELIQHKQHEEVLKILFDKLRPNGKIVIKFLNARLLAQKLLDYEVSSDEFFELIKNNNSLVSLENLYTMIDLSILDILNIDFDEYQIVLILERKNI